MPYPTSKILVGQGDGGTNDAGSRNDDHGHFDVRRSGEYDSRRYESNRYEVVALTPLEAAGLRLELQMGLERLGSERMGSEDSERFEGSDLASDDGCARLEIAGLGEMEQEGPGECEEEHGDFETHDANGSENVNPSPENATDATGKKCDAHFSQQSDTDGTTNTSWTVWLYEVNSRALQSRWCLPGSSISFLEKYSPIFREGLDQARNSCLNNLSILGDMSQAPIDDNLNSSSLFLANTNAFSLSHEQTQLTHGMWTAWFAELGGSRLGSMAETLRGSRDGTTDLIRSSNESKNSASSNGSGGTNGTAFSWGASSPQAREDRAFLLYKSGIFLGIEKKCVTMVLGQILGDGSGEGILPERIVAESKEGRKGEEVDAEMTVVADAEPAEIDTASELDAAAPSESNASEIDAIASSESGSVHSSVRDPEMRGGYLGDSRKNLRSNLVENQSSNQKFQNYMAKSIADSIDIVGGGWGGKTSEDADVRPSGNQHAAPLASVPEFSAALGAYDPPNLPRDSIEVVFQNTSPRQRPPRNVRSHNDDANQANGDTDRIRFSPNNADSIIFASGNLRDAGSNWRKFRNEDNVQGSNLDPRAPVDQSMQESIEVLSMPRNQLSSGPSSAAAKYARSSRSRLSKDYLPPATIVEDQEEGPDSGQNGFNTFSRPDNFNPRSSALRSSPRVDESIQVISRPRGENRLAPDSRRRPRDPLSDDPLAKSADRLAKSARESCYLDESIQILSSLKEMKDREIRQSREREIREMSKSREREIRGSREGREGRNVSETNSDRILRNLDDTSINNNTSHNAFNVESVDITNDETFILNRYNQPCYKAPCGRSERYAQEMNYPFEPAIPANASEGNSDEVKVESDSNDHSREDSSDNELVLGNADDTEHDSKLDLTKTANEISQFADAAINRLSLVLQEMESTAAETVEDKRTEERQKSKIEEVEGEGTEGESRRREANTAALEENINRGNSSKMPMVDSWNVTNSLNFPQEEPSTENLQDNVVGTSETTSQGQVATASERRKGDRKHSNEQNEDELQSLFIQNELKRWQQEAKTQNLRSGNESASNNARANSVDDNDIIIENSDVDDNKNDIDDISVAGSETHVRSEVTQTVAGRESDDDGADLKLDALRFARAELRKLESMDLHESEISRTQIQKAENSVNTRSEMSRDPRLKQEPVRHDRDCRNPDGDTNTGIVSNSLQDSPFRNSFHKTSSPIINAAQLEKPPEVTLSKSSVLRNSTRKASTSVLRARAQAQQLRSPGSVKNKKTVTLRSRKSRSPKSNSSSPNKMLNFENLEVGKNIRSTNSCSISTSVESLESLKSNEGGKGNDCSVLQGDAITGQSPKPRGMATPDDKDNDIDQFLAEVSIFDNMQRVRSQRKLSQNGSPEGLHQEDLTQSERLEDPRQGSASPGLETAGRMDELLDLGRENSAVRLLSNAEEPAIRVIQDREELQELQPAQSAETELSMMAEVVAASIQEPQRLNTQVGEVQPEDQIGQVQSHNQIEQLPALESLESLPRSNSERKMHSPSASPQNKPRRVSLKELHDQPDYELRGGSLQSRNVIDSERPEEQIPESDSLNLVSQDNPQYTSEPQNEAHSDPNEELQSGLQNNLQIQSPRHDIALTDHRTEELVGDQGPNRRSSLVEPALEDKVVDHSEVATEVAPSVAVTPRSCRDELSRRAESVTRTREDAPNEFPGKERLFSDDANDAGSSEILKLQTLVVPDASSNTQTPMDDGYSCATSYATSAPSMASPVMMMQASAQNSPFVGVTDVSSLPNRKRQLADANSNAGVYPPPSPVESSSPLQEQQRTETAAHENSGAAADNIGTKLGEKVYEKTSGIQIPEIASILNMDFGLGRFGDVSLADVEEVDDVTPDNAKVQVSESSVKGSVNDEIQLAKMPEGTVPVKIPDREDIPLRFATTKGESEGDKLAEAPNSDGDRSTQNDTHSDTNSNAQSSILGLSTVFENLSGLFEIGKLKVEEGEMVVDEGNVSVLPERQVEEKDEKTDEKKFPKAEFKAVTSDPSNADVQSQSPPAGVKRKDLGLSTVLASSPMDIQPSNKRPECLVTSTADQTHIQPSTASRTPYDLPPHNLTPHNRTPIRHGTINSLQKSGNQSAANRSSEKLRQSGDGMRQSGEGMRQSGDVMLRKSLRTVALFDSLDEKFYQALRRISDKYPGIADITEDLNHPVEHAAAGQEAEHRPDAQYLQQFHDQQIAVRQQQPVFSSGATSVAAVATPYDPSGHSYIGPSTAVPDLGGYCHSMNPTPSLSAFLEGEGLVGVSDNANPASKSPSLHRVPQRTAVYDSHHEDPAAAQSAIPDARQPEPGNTGEQFWTSGGDQIVPTGSRKMLARRHSDEGFLNRSHDENPTPSAGTMSIPTPQRGNTNGDANLHEGQNLAHIPTFAQTAPAIPTNSIQNAHKPMAEDETLKVNNTVTTPKATQRSDAQRMMSLLSPDAVLRQKKLSLSNSLSLDHDANVFFESDMLHNTHTRKGTNPGFTFVGRSVGSSVAPGRSDNGSNKSSQTSHPAKEVAAGQNSECARNAPSNNENMESSESSDREPSQEVLGAPQLGVRVPHLGGGIDDNRSDHRIHAPAGAAFRDQKVVLAKNRTLKKKRHGRQLRLAFPSDSLGPIEEEDPASCRSDPPSASKKLQSPKADAHFATPGHQKPPENVNFAPPCHADLGVSDSAGPTSRGARNDNWDEGYNNVNTNEDLRKLQHERAAPAAVASRQIPHEFESQRGFEETFRPVESQYGSGTFSAFQQLLVDDDSGFDGNARTDDLNLGPGCSYDYQDFQGGADARDNGTSDASREMQAGWGSGNVRGDRENNSRDVYDSGNDNLPHAPAVTSSSNADPMNIMNTFTAGAQTPKSDQIERIRRLLQESLGNDSKYFESTLLETAGVQKADVERLDGDDGRRFEQQAGSNYSTMSSTTTQLKPDLNESGSLGYSDYQREHELHPTQQGIPVADRSFQVADRSFQHSADHFSEGNQQLQRNAHGLRYNSDGSHYNLHRNPNDDPDGFHDQYGSYGYDGSYADGSYAQEVDSYVDDDVEIPQAVEMARRRAAEYRVTDEKRQEQEKKERDEKLRARFAKRDERIQEFREKQKKKKQISEIH